MSDEVVSVCGTAVHVESNENPIASGLTGFPVFIATSESILKIATVSLAVVPAIDALSVPPVAAIFGASGSTNAAGLAPGDGGTGEIITVTPVAEKSAVAPGDGCGETLTVTYAGSLDGSYPLDPPFPLPITMVVPEPSA